jgi:hypothetical protein
MIDMDKIMLVLVAENAKTEPLKTSYRKTANLNNDMDYGRAMRP